MKQLAEFPSVRLQRVTVAFSCLIKGIRQAAIECVSASLTTHTHTTPPLTHTPTPNQAPPPSLPNDTLNTLSSHYLWRGERSPAPPPVWVGAVSLAIRRARRLVRPVPVSLRWLRDIRHVPSASRPSHARKPHAPTHALRLASATRRCGNTTWGICTERAQYGRCERSADSGRLAMKCDVFFFYCYIVALGWVDVLIFSIYFVLLAVSINNTHLILLMSPTKIIHLSAPINHKVREATKNIRSWLGANRCVSFAELN